MTETRDITESRSAMSAASRLWLRLIQGAPDPPPLVTPRWKWLWPMLAAALAIRIMQAAFSDWSMRADVTMQYLEQAHRLVFGYGFIPWEFRFGVRTWLIPAITSPPLFFVRALGIDDPDIYIPLVGMWNALLSMAVPAGMYFYMRRMISEQAGRIALLFGCFWYEFLVFAPQALSESYASALFMAGLAAVPYVRRAPALFIVGFLLGLAVAVRVPYAPAVAVCGIFWLMLLPFRRWGFPLAGGACALLLWGAVDYLTWGGWWASIINYATLVPLVHSQYFPPIYLATLMLAVSSFGLYVLCIILGIRAWRRQAALLIMALAVYVPASNPHTQEYSNVFLLFPLLWMLAAGTICHWRRRSRTALFVAAAVVSAVGLAGKLPHMNMLIGVRSGPLLFRNSNWFLDTRAVRSALESEDVHAVAWNIAENQIQMGGYYHLHLNVPLYLPTDSSSKIFGDALAVEFFSHIISFDSFPPSGFSLLPHPATGRRRIFVYRNNMPERVLPIKDYTYNLSSPHFFLAGEQYYEYMWERGLFSGTPDVVL